MADGSSPGEKPSMPKSSIMLLLAEKLTIPKVGMPTEILLHIIFPMLDIE